MSIFQRLKHWLRSLFNPTLSVLKRLTAGLNYRSESDDTWRVFAPMARRTGVVTPVTMERLTGLTFIEQQDFETFMQHSIDTQPQRDRYVDLREGLIEMLAGRQVYRMSGTSPFNLTIYVVGIDFQNDLFGISVGVTET